jgi:hypothetical protein
MQQGIRTQIFWLVYAYAFLFTSVVAEASNSWFRAGSTSTSEEVNVNVKAELGPLLSEEAEIVTRGDEAYGAATARWQYWAAPDVKAVVVVARKEDVRQTVCFRFILFFSVPAKCICICIGYGLAIVLHDSSLASNLIRTA